MITGTARRLAPSCDVGIHHRVAFDAVSGHDGVAGDDVFDCAGEDVAVVGEAGGERGSVVECVFLFDKSVIEFVCIRVN